MRQLLILAVTYLAIAQSAQAADGTPIKLKIFGQPRSRVGGCTMGASTETMKKLKRKDEKENSLTYWLSAKTPVSPEDQKLFKNDPVSYIVTFEGKNDIGTF